ncbi:histone-lysine N-methyltransferaseH3 lysine-9 specific 3-like [Aphelenchoides avenae]|nr:histone-lysine N-methyltransferaseH3 lysine-9 specific 3-like [Aphelenchus avenae]
MDDGLLCDDISRNNMKAHGTSLFPIPVINDMDDDLLDARFNYTEWNVDSDGKFREKHMRGCSCEGKCGKDCECVKRSTIQLYEDGRVKGVSKLWDSMHAYDLYECSEICSCSEMCGHRMSPPVYSIKSALFKTEHAGFAVECLQYIEQGTFVAEFVGEMVARDEQTNRTQEYAYQIFSKDSRSELFVDPTRFGNIARFFNHSCFPNLVPIRYYKRHRNVARPSIGFVAWRDAVPGDELSIDYGQAWWEQRIQEQEGFFCRCSSKFCYYPAPGRLQLDEKDVEREMERILRGNRKRLLLYKKALAVNGITTNWRERALQLYAAKCEREGWKPHLKQQD